MPQIVVIACRQTNYAYLICDAASKTCAAVDPGDADKVAAAIKAHGLWLTHILCTHHHADHIDGVAQLVREFAAQTVVVVGAAGEPRIPSTKAVQDGAILDLPAGRVRVLTLPGHTRGSVGYLFGGALFAGDTLFAMGSGKLFEGDAAVMLESLAKITALPDDTAIYPGHEYTLVDARFAMTVEPENAAIGERAVAVEAGAQTVPFTLAQEKQTNPFLRFDAPSVRKALGLEAASSAAAFAEIRRRKDAF